VPGEPRAEGAARGTRGSRAGSPDRQLRRPARRRDQLALPKLAEVDLSNVEAHERKHKNRKTVLQKIESLRKARD
jgi:hypothetical protein